MKGNVAFKFNYCDGKDGGGIDCVGFHGLCSPEMIRYNIEKRKAAWCSNPDCACGQYFEACKKQINSGICVEDYYYQLLQKNEPYPCGESFVLKEWKATAQYDWTGIVPRARRICNADPSGLVVLTTVFPGHEGRERKIFAVYLAGEIFEGDNEECGFIVAHSKYRLEMTQQQAEQLNFWEFHRNERSGKPFWGTGVFRYLYDDECARILRRIVSIKHGTREENLAQELFQFYCQIHKIDQADVL